MFPNPQDALPLPSRPSVERYRKLAKELVKAAKSGDKTAVGEWADQWIRSLAKLAGLNSKRRRLDKWTNQVEDFARRKLSEKSTLASAQFVIARSHGFESWQKFSKHMSSPRSRFEAAADAIVNGDAATLKRLLREDPKLVRAKSSREHGATLLHYTSANGVEGYRQKTPKNIVKIAQILLEAGAEIDVTADVYGGGCTTLGLSATSVWPEKVGVQEALLQKLLDHGASMEIPSAGNKHSLITACLANGRPKAAEFLASRGAKLDQVGAAALGRLDEVKRFFDGDGRLKTSATTDQLNEGFWYAAGYGRKNVVEFLLAKNVDLSARSGDGQTALHWAVIGGQLDVVRLLLRHNPPLEAKNDYGGTVFGQAMWSAAHGGDPDAYIAILEALADAGAKIPERHVPVNARVDAWLAQHGSRAEPSWYWFGEKPRG